MAGNGRVPSTSLRTFDGTPLLSSTRNALKVAALLGELIGVAVRPAAGVGSGYRDLAMQTLFYRAAHGDRTAAQTVGLSSASSVAVALPGSSSHGTGNRVDVVFNGSDSPTRDQIALMNHCGFTREFGADDPNHFEHDGRTAISGPNSADWNRIVAHYLNGRHLGKTTTTVQDGRVDRSKYQNYTWEVQAAGIADRLYPSPPYKHDGIPGPKTDTVAAHYRNVLWTSVG